MTIYGLNMDGLGTDTRQAKIRRATFGAFYGFLGGLAFVVMAAFIDILLHPDLPYGVDWSTFMMRLPLIALGLALVGAVTCWWHEAWQGLLSGAAVAATLTLVVSLFSAEITTGLKFIVLVFILIPVAAMTLPIAYILRWLPERHAAVMHLKWNSVRVAWLIVIVLALGAGCGYFMKTSTPGVQVARFINELLQDPSQTKSPISKVPGVLEHQDMPYKLYQKKSVFSTEGYDVYAKYEDGFVLKCVVVLYPGRDPYLSACMVDP